MSTAGLSRIGAMTAGFGCLNRGSEVAQNVAPLLNVQNRLAIDVLCALSFRCDLIRRLRWGIITEC